MIFKLHSCECMDFYVNNRFFIVVALLFISCSKEEVSIPKYEMSYDLYSETKLDVYSKDYGRRSFKPVIIYVHGGSWCSGDKSEWSLRQTRFFIDNGYICVSINYRLSPLYASNSTQPHIMHPTQICDVANAIAWVESHIIEYGGDPSRLILIGHSAGAHLVALYITNQRYSERAGAKIRNVKGACLLDGGAYLTMDDLVYSDTIVLNMIYNVVGTDSSSWLWEDFSPLANIKQDYIPSVFLIYTDNEYRMACNRKFSEALSDAGFTCNDYVLKSYSHSEVLSRFPFYAGDQFFNEDFIINMFNKL